jgi:hypothetical protein
VSLDPALVDANSLEIFLRHYAPIQLAIDRVKNHILSLPRRTLDILSHLRNAHRLVSCVDSFPDASSIPIAEKHYRLSKLLSVSPKATLPHPSWKPYHDAVLVAAIAKHGWIDKESNCRDIINDKDVKWGEPFGAGDIAVSECNQSDSSSNDDVPAYDKEEFKKVALRAISFLEDVKDTKELKGFNLNLVLKTYAIESVRSTNEDGQAEIAWNFDPSLKECESSGKSTDVDMKNDSYVDLPTRKDLLKRAKIILGKPLDSSKPSNEEDTGANHDYIILDQGNIYNIFLAELLREVSKFNQKTMKLGRKALSCALLEIEQRLESINDENEHEDFCKLRDHIKLVDRHLKKKISRPAKNVVRAILGITPVPPMNPGDEMFVVDKHGVANGAVENVSSKSKPVKKTSESALGDQAINKAIAAAKQKAKNGASDDSDQMLGITTVETLMLSVMCSQGIPLYDENWEKMLNYPDDDESIDDEYLITWYHLGNVLEVAAEKWVEISQNQVTRHNSEGYDTTQLEMELKLRIDAHQRAVELHDKPIHLARKAVMLIEAIRQHMGPESKQKGKNGIKAEHGIGTRVFQWNKSHLNKWARSLTVLDDGKTRALHSMAIVKDSVASGLLDKKNCKAVFTQISQQSRLRSLFAKYGEKKLLNMVSKAVKAVKRSGDVWEDEPVWWGKNVTPVSQDDFDLLAGVLKFGYGGFDQMVKDNERFCQLGGNNSSHDRLYRSSGQHRVNSLTRELSAIDDSEETLRLMNERKKKTATSKQSTKSNKDTKNSSGYTRQVGIDAFFAPTKSAAPIEEISDDSEIAVLTVLSPPKRKTDDNDTSDNGSHQKKRKS